jgi:hypothetical protein
LKRIDQSEDLGVDIEVEFSNFGEPGVYGRIKLDVHIDILRHIHQTE